MKHTRLALALSFVPALAHAHPGHGIVTGGIGWGLAHPFTGLDHILAMIAVGLWAVQIGKRALWLLPLSFVSAAALGAALGMSGVRLPLVEPAILASVIGIGALVAFATRLPLAVSVAILSLAAIFHGQAHGSELPADSSGIQAILGFIIATTILHAIGIAAGLALERTAKHGAIRLAGAAILSAAVLMGLGVL